MLKLKLESAQGKNHGEVWRSRFYQYQTCCRQARGRSNPPEHVQSQQHAKHSSPSRQPVLTRMQVFN